MSFLSPQDNIWSAVKRGDLNAVREFAARDGFPDIEDSYSTQSLLTVACAVGHLDVIRFLLENRSKIKTLNYGSPEAFAAMEYGRIEVLRLLAEFDALDPDAKKFFKYDLTLFQVAVQERHVEVARLLLSLGGCLDTTITDAMDDEITEEEVKGEEAPWPSFLELAVRTGDVEFVRFLLAIGADPAGKTADYYLEQAQHNAWKHKETAPDLSEQGQPQPMTFNHSKVEQLPKAVSDSPPADLTCAFITTAGFSFCLLTIFAILRFIPQLLLWLGWTGVLLWVLAPLGILFLSKSTVKRK